VVADLQPPVRNRWSGVDRAVARRRTDAIRGSNQDGYRDSGVPPHPRGVSAVRAGRNLAQYFTDLGQAIHNLTATTIGPRR